jgi:uncharacterized protein YgiM (DUF1202 family)
VDPIPYLAKETLPSEPQADDFPGTFPLPDLQLEVDADSLNVRSGPGVEYSIVGQLTKGMKITAKHLNSRSAWIEYETGKWCALAFEGTVYLKNVK